MPTINPVKLNQKATIILVAVAFIVVVLLIIVITQPEKVKNVIQSNMSNGINNYERGNTWLTDSAKYPRSIRNNNVGNIVIANYNWRGKVPQNVNTDRKFEQFYRFENGVRALIKQVIAYKNDNHNTPYKFAEQYVSGEGAVNINLYANDLANALHIGKNDIIDFTPLQIKEIVFAIDRRENGKQFLNDYWYNLGFSIL